MGLELNTNLYNSYGIDKASVNQVASQILKSSANQQQATVQSIDYSKFNRPTLGVDLYSGRTNLELQKQIAMTQAGLYAQSVNVAKLNSQAAMNLYSAATVQKNVEMTQSVAAGAELTGVNKLENNNNVIHLFNIQDKNPNSSNGFNPFKSENEDSKEEKADKEMKLFA